ncbi:MAG TPA: hypothetical protein VFU94_15325 [Conexibacter sp.]|nr:hypothetical protein [Conexibacter sp.]
MSERRGGALGRAIAAWRALPPERRLAAVAAAALFVTMLLPWYQVQSRALNDSITAFGAFSFVEAAVLLVALAVLALLFQRAEGRAFHLPGGDGTVVMAAGLWVLVLLVWRLFDKPHVSGAIVGVEWGIFFAIAAAGLLAYAGSRMRHAARPEPPLAGHPRGARPPSTRRPAPSPAPPPAPGTTVTQVLPPERPRRARPAPHDEQLTIPLPPHDEPE